MPYKRVVPKCKGDYKNFAKVHVFSFTKDIELSDVWFRRIKIDKFSIMKYNRVSISYSKNK